MNLWGKGKEVKLSRSDGVLGWERKQGGNLRKGG